MKKNTSIHSINADRHLSHPMKVAYLFANWLNNLFPESYVDSKIEQRLFAPENVDEFFTAEYWKCSPSRLLSDLFWAGLDWESISRRLGKIRILDIGCGPGRYVERFKKFSGNRIESHHGIDVYKPQEWRDVEAKYGDVFFSGYDGTDISFALERHPNLIITQSALEHHESDLTLFMQLAAYTHKSLFPVMQIHLVPSAACLRLYLFHGVRQYTPRTISKITKLFGDNNNFALYSLGGRGCNDLHWNYITKPLLMKKKDRREEEGYPRKLIMAVKEKVCLTHPAFYALVIKGCYQKLVW